jgi:anti-sigma-K factor RskA
MTAPDRGTPERRCGNDVASYVLGALEPGEARAFADHLGTCEACRDEVAALMPVLDVLASCAPRREVSAALRRRVMDAVRSEPKASSAAAGRPGRAPRRRGARVALARRRGARVALARPRVGAVAAAAVLALAVVFGVMIAGRSGGSPARVIQARVGRARVEIADNHGELIVDHLPRPPLGRIYELWLRHGAGPPAPTTLFTVTSRGTAELGLPGALTGITGVLVTLEPIGGSRAPTTRPVIVARLV